MSSASSARLARLLPWLQAAVIVAAGWFVYAPALHGGWVWDDRADIVENPMLRSGLGLWKIWFEPARLYDFYPLKYTVQWLQWQLWQENTPGYHVTNLVLHLAGAFVFWRVLRQLGLRLAWLGALLFTVHPVAVESVAWCVELKNTLSLPPLLLAASAFIAFDASGRRADYARALAWFVVAMLCKASGVMLPVTLLLFCWWKRGALGWRDAKRTAPFFAVSLVFGLVTLWFQEHRGMGPEPVLLGGLARRLAIAGTSGAFYLWKCVWPAELLPIYPQWSVDPPAAWHFLPWLGMAATIAWCWARRATWGRHALLGLGWFALHLAPFVGLTAISHLRFSWAMDHLAYLSLLGLAGLAAAGVEAMWSHASRGVRWLAAAGVTLVVALLAVRAHRQAEVYRDEFTFWTFAAGKNPAAWMARHNLGLLLDRRGRHAEALAHLEAALRLRPAYPDAHKNYADLLRADGRTAEARAHYEEALRLKPSYAEAHNNLGELLLAAGETAAALAQFNLALQSDPESPEAHNNVGQILRDAGRLSEAIAYFAVALQFRPESPEIHNNLAMTLRRAGRTTEALAHYETALRLRPGFAEVRFNLGNALQELGRHAEAVAAYEQALRDKPQFSAAHKNAAISLHALGREAEAREHYAEARRLNPLFPPWPY